MRILYELIENVGKIGINKNLTDGKIAKGIFENFVFLLHFDFVHWRIMNQRWKIFQIIKNNE